VKLEPGHCPFPSAPHNVWKKEPEAGSGGGGGEEGEEEGEEAEEDAFVELQGASCEPRT
jgi:hypothetical protein